jgi:hypothetical protein
VWWLVAYRYRSLSACQASRGSASRAERRFSRAATMDDRTLVGLSRSASRKAMTWLSSADG